jgi:hypothetical protein
MSASKSLSRLFLSLLDSGITIDDGRERIIIAASRPMGRRGTRGAAAFTIRSLPSGRSHPNHLPEFPTTAFTPTGKVSSRKLHAIIAHFPEGISSADLTTQSGVAREKLIPTIQKLAAKGLVSEKNGWIHPVLATSGEVVRTSRRRVHDSCTVANCHDPHYAKGLCNNHYNSMRRQQVRVAGLVDMQRRMAGSYKEAILNRLTEASDQTLFELASFLNQKWQTLRKDIQELIDEAKVVKDGKQYRLS